MIHMTQPENLIIDSSGYLKIIDFGFAKHIPFMKNGVQHSQSYTICGTPDYLAPELVLSKGHDKAVDYWALGVLIYELIVGKTPFMDDNQPEVFRKIVHSKKYLTFKGNFGSSAVDIIRKLLTPSQSFRLGKKVIPTFFILVI